MKFNINIKKHKKEIFNSSGQLIETNIPQVEYELKQYDKEITSKLNNNKND